VVRVLDHGLAVLMVVAAAGEVWTGHHNFYAAALLGVGVIAALCSLGLAAGPRVVRSSPVSPENASQG
jgi:hypothetical protein